MFGFLKKMCCSGGEKTLEEKQQMAHEQDRLVRESLSQKQIDKEVKDTFPASDPVTKY
jgi:hypothetical protein